MSKEGGIVFPDIRHVGSVLEVGTNPMRTSEVRMGGSSTPVRALGDLEVDGNAPGGSGGGGPAGSRVELVLGSTGQSNDEGWSLAALVTDAARLYYARHNIFRWSAHSGEAYFGQRALFTQPVPRRDRTGLVAGDGYSLGFAAAVELQRAQTDPRTEITVVDGGVGDTGILEEHAPGGTLFNAFVAQMNAALASSPYTQLGPVIVSLGERDAKLGRSSGQFQAAQAAFVAALRAGITGGSQLVVIWVGMNPVWLVNPSASSYSSATTAAMAAEIHYAQMAAPRRAGMARTAWVPGPAGSSNHNPGDPVHYSAAGQWKLGADAIAIGYAQALANVEELAAPGAPLLTVTPTSGTVARFVVQPADTRHAYFEIDHRAFNSSTWSSVANTGPVETRDVSGMPLGQRVGRARSIGRGGTSTWSAEFSWNQVQLPSAPALSLVNAGATSIEVSWTDPTDGSPFTGFDLRYRQEGSGEGGWVVIVLGDVNAHTISPVATGVTFEIEVLARNANGPGPYSNRIIAETGALPTISDAGWIIPDWANGRARLGWTLTGGSAAGVLFETRAYNSSDPWSPVSPFSADASVVVLPLNPITTSFDLRVTGDGAPQIFQWIATLRPAQDLNIAGSTRSGSAPFEISSTPNSGTGTAWIQSGANSIRPLYDTTTFPGRRSRHAGQTGGGRTTTDYPTGARGPTWWRCTGTVRAPSTATRLPARGLTRAGPTDLATRAASTCTSATSPPGTRSAPPRPG